MTKTAKGMKKKLRLTSRLLKKGTARCVSISGGAMCEIHSATAVEMMTWISSFRRPGRPSLERLVSFR